MFVCGAIADIIDKIFHQKYFSGQNCDSVIPKACQTSDMSTCIYKTELGILCYYYHTWIIIIIIMWWESHIKNHRQ
jgi:hypothetical protein